MVPDVWVRMDVLPRNANGKVLRGDLPQGMDPETMKTVRRKIETGWTIHL